MPLIFAIDGGRAVIFTRESKQCACGHVALVWINQRGITRCVACAEVEPR